MKVFKGTERWAAEYMGVGARMRRKWFDTEQAARRWAEENDIAPPQGPERRKAQVTLGDAVAGYYEAELSATRDADVEACRVDMLRRSQVGRLPVMKVRTADLQDYCSERLRTVLTETVRNELRIIRRALAFARDRWELRLKVNVAMGVSLPSRGPKRTRRLTESEARRIVAELGATSTAQAIVRLALETGLSRRAILDLTWSDLRPDTGTLAVSNADGAKEEVALTERSLAVLGSQNPVGRRCFKISAERFRWQWQGALERAGLEDVRFDDLRKLAVDRLRHGSAENSAT